MTVYIEVKFTQEKMKTFNNFYTKFKSTIYDIQSDGIYDDGNGSYHDYTILVLDNSMQLNVLTDLINRGITNIITHIWDKNSEESY